MRINEQVPVISAGSTFEDALAAEAGFGVTRDTVIALILAYAPSGDTSHYSFFDWVIGLQDTIDQIQSSIGSGGFDTTYVYQAIALKLAKLDFDDSLYAYIAATLGDDDSIATGSTVIAYLIGQNYINSTMLNDSNYVRTDETTGWDKNASDDYPSAGEEVFTTAEKSKLSGIAAGAEVNVNADWSSSSGDSQILNKPTVPVASDVAYNATTWNANTDVPTKNAVRDEFENRQTIANMETVGLTGSTTKYPNDAVVTAQLNDKEKVFQTYYMTTEDIEVATNANVFVDLAGSLNLRVVFSSSSINGSKCLVRIIGIDPTSDCLLDFSNVLNGTDANITLTSADNGSTFIFMFLTDTSYWYQIL